MKILQINSVVNSGSTGRIAEDIGKVLMAHGHESYIAYGRGNRPSDSNTIKIGTAFDVYAHGAKTLLFDLHGFGSKSATQKLIRQIEKIGPDVIGLHNLHGYYINIEVLFDFLEQSGIPVVWTLHDCWAFTGHCAYFESIGCQKWKSECHTCPSLKNYPKTIGPDFSKRNFLRKKKLFNKPHKIYFVTPSNWLNNLLHQSFLREYPSTLIHNGIDLELFNIKKIKCFENEKIELLGVASTWSRSKGLFDFIHLANLLPDNRFHITLIGLNEEQIKLLPNNITGIRRTENVQKLVEYYKLADIFINPTYSDNFPTTNLEALACGTPVITYNTGGSPEAIDEETGIVVKQGDIKGIFTAILTLESLGLNEISSKCRLRAEMLYNKNERYLDYLDIFNEIIKKK